MNILESRLWAKIKPTSTEEDSASEQTPQKFNQRSIKYKDKLENQRKLIKSLTLENSKLKSDNESYLHEIEISKEELSKTQDELLKLRENFLKLQQDLSNSEQESSVSRQECLKYQSYHELYNNLAQSLFESKIINCKPCYIKKKNMKNLRSSINTIIY